MTGCDLFGSEEENGLPEGPGETSVTVMFNPTDPLLVRSTVDDGTVLEYFGRRDSDGLPTNLDQVVIQGAEGEICAEMQEDGLPQEFTDESGTSFQFEWTSPTTAVLTAISSTGEYQVNTLVDFNNPDPSSVNAHFSQDQTLNIRSGKRSVLGSQPRQKNAAAIKQASTSEVQVNVVECERPARFADVDVVARDTDGNFLLSVPAVQVSEGTYRASLPTNITPTYNPQEICLQLEGVLGISCIGLAALGGPSGAFATCSYLAVALDALTIPSGEAIPLIAACDRATKAWTLLCSSLGASAVEGAPSLADFLCRGTYEDRRIETDVVLQAVVAGLPNNIASGSVTSSPNGPFPTLTVDLGERVSIRSLELEPANPASAVDYVATAVVECVTEGTTITMSIVGTDGYTDSRTTTVTETEFSGTFTLTVPGAETGVRDVVTLKVSLPTGESLTREASLVFG